MIRIERRWPVLLVLMGGCELFAPLEPLPAQDGQGGSGGAATGGGGSPEGGRDNTAKGGDKGVNPSGGAAGNDGLGGAIATGGNSHATGGMEPEIGGAAGVGGAGGSPEGFGGNSVVGGSGTGGTSGGTGGTTEQGGASGEGGTIGGAGGQGGASGQGGEELGGSGGHEGSTIPSCADMLGAECQGTDCCESPAIVGGTFAQGTPTAHEATVASFRLDAYEVTVGRFRKFSSAYDAWRAAGNPEAEAGKHPLIPMSGWDTDWSVSLPASAAQFASSNQLKCDGAFATWVDRSGNELLPINCVSWYLAFAFCVWDKGRLPTESEWEYAAAGGSELRPYPWGSPAPDATRAVYGCPSDGSLLGDCILPVGSKIAGVGRYGQFDLAGSLQEWTLDWFGTYPTGPVANYANLEPGSSRVTRGGDFGSGPNTLNPAHRDSQTPSQPGGWIGLRCARAYE